jgi:hypothetical protein
MPVEYAKPTVPLPTDEEFNSVFQDAPQTIKISIKILATVLLSFAALLFTILAVVITHMAFDLQHQQKSDADIGTVRSSQEKDHGVLAQVSETAAATAGVVKQLTDNQEKQGILLDNTSEGIAALKKEARWARAKINDLTKKNNELKRRVDALEKPVSSDSDAELKQPIQ